MFNLTLLRNANVYAPHKLGLVDVLIGGRSILAVGAGLGVSDVPTARVVDLGGKTLVPGLVDGHLHQVGGCGMQGYASRAPELWPGELSAAGITTSVAAPGMDMVTKTMESMLAKVYALESDGLSAYAFLGGARLPHQVLTGSIHKDLFLIEKLIGVKVFLGEGAGSSYSDAALIDLASELQWAAEATGKACLLHAHMGQSRDPAGQLLSVLRSSAAAPERFQATHGNYTEHTMLATLELTKSGCPVDLNPLLDPRAGVRNSIGVQEALPRLLDQGVDPSLLTMSTDGNANVPRLQPNGSRGPYVKNLGSLWGAVRELTLDCGLELQDVLPLVTANPARILQLQHKGSISVGSDADLLILDSTLEIMDVYAKGQQLVSDGIPLRYSMYERHEPEHYPYPPLDF